MSYLPENDGIDHINVYSKGKTKLGKMLSNFAWTPFVLDEIGPFCTVEGWWYYTLTGDERFRTTSGWESKELGKKLPVNGHIPTEEELADVYEAKLQAHPQIKKMLNECSLPLAHYYVYSGKVVEPKEWQWTAQLWNTFR